MTDALANGYRIWFDLQPVQTTHEPERGIPRYVIEVARALQRAAAPIAALGVNPWLPSDGLPPELASAPTLHQGCASAFAAAAGSGPLLYHVLSPFEAVEPRESLVPPYVRPPHALVAMVHDLIPFRFPERYQTSAEARQFFTARAELLRQADLFVTLSEHSRRDLLELLDVDPARCAVVGAGVSDWFRPPAAGDDPAGLIARAVPALDRPFVLSVAGAEWRKNNETLLAAYAALPAAVRSDHQLAIAARLTDATRAWFDEELRRNGLVAGRDVVLAGVVDDEVLRALYQRASLFVFPSRYEGFGLPVLEAARCGTVAIVADSSSLPEVLDAPEATFPPEDVDALAGLMARALGDTDLRDRLLDAGRRAVERHTWDHVAERLLAAYESLPPPASPPARHRPSTVAVLGPFRGSSHRLRGRAEALVAALADDAAVDCFADGRGPITPVPHADRTLPVEAFGHPFDPHAYDAVVCVVGNDPELLATRDVLLGGATVAWLPDQSYEALVLGVVPHGAADDEAAMLLAGELHRAYGSAWVDVVDVDGDPLDPATYRRAGLRFAGVLASAAAVVVAPPAAAAALPSELRMAGAAKPADIVTAAGDAGVAAVAAALRALGATRAGR